VDYSVTSSRIAQPAGGAEIAGVDITGVEIVYPCYLVPQCPLPRFQSSQPAREVCKTSYFYL